MTRTLDERKVPRAAWTLLSGDDGIALLMVLVVITILASLVVSITDTTQKHLQVTRFYKNRLQAYWAAQSGVQAAAALLKVDAQQNRGYDGAESPWNCESEAYQEFVVPLLANVFCGSSIIEPAIPLEATDSVEEETTLRRCPPVVPIADENRKLSLYGLVKGIGTANENTDEATFDRVSYLLQVLLKEEDLRPTEQEAGDQEASGSLANLTVQGNNIELGTARRLAGYLVDWMDTENNKNTDLNPDTAEDRCPEDGLPYEAKNGMLDSIDEIGLVCGFRQMRHTTIQRLSRHMTAYDLKTNLNTATYPVLHAFFAERDGMGETISSQIYEEIHLGPGQKVTDRIPKDNKMCRQLLRDLNADPNLCEEMGVASDTFRISLYGAVFDTETGTIEARSRIQMVLRRSRGQALSLLYYRED